jgi:hypothetical protein
MLIVGHRHLSLPQSSSGSRFTAGASGLFILSQSAGWPERYGEQAEGGRPISTSHQAVAETLHIELPNVASSVCGFGFFPADLGTTYLRER